MIVLDTNVLSEFMKPAAKREPNVVQWLRSYDITDVFTTAVTLAEVYAGVLILPAGGRRTAIQDAADRIFTTIFPDRILPFDEPAARIYAEIMTQRRRERRTFDALDIQIASVAKSRGMAVATRNVIDFEGSGVDVIDPWTA